MAQRVLVFGSTGQLARELARAAWSPGTEPIFLGRGEADLSRPDSLAPIVERYGPAAVVIAAAYTAVDKAESEEALAMAVNASAPAVISAAAAALAIPVVHVSTDYVFDGSKDGWYSEDDECNPLGIYGRSKLAGEAGVSAVNPRHVILRTSWVYSPFGANFVRTMLRLAVDRDEIAVVADQHGCPTAARDLANAISGIVPRLLGADAPAGVFHLAGPSATTWHGFAEAIFATLAMRGMRRPISRAIGTAEYPTLARRPQNSRLASDRFQAVFGLRLPRWEDTLPQVLDELLGVQASSGRRGST